MRVDELRCFACHYDDYYTLFRASHNVGDLAHGRRRVRKYYLGVSIISQQANDFLKNDYGRAIASQRALRILMKQDTATIKGAVSSA